MKAIAQEGSMGCGVACAASLSGLSYQKMLSLFEDGNKKDKTTGFYNKDFVNALGKIGVKVEGFSKKGWGDRRINTGTIAFVARSKMYPAGHFLLKTKDGWMNPWINHPSYPIKAGFQKKLLGRVEWVIKTRKLKTSSNSVH